jgi:hypothetical protein
VAELAMTVAADTIHTAFFLGAFFFGINFPNRRLSIYIPKYIIINLLECKGYVWWGEFSQAIKLLSIQNPIPFYANDGMHFFLK